MYVARFSVRKNTSASTTGISHGMTSSTTIDHDRKKIVIDKMSKAIDV